MNRDQQKLEARREYIRSEIEDSSGVSTTRKVKELAKELFLSESTIWKAFAKASNKN